MKPALANPDRNFSADGAPKGAARSSEAAKRKIVARRLREFFALLIAQLSGGSTELWDRAERRLRRGRSDEP